MHNLSNIDAPNSYSLIAPEDLLPYKSDYLSGGWRKDELVLNHVRVENDKKIYIGNFSLLDCFVPADGVFHFTVPLAFICVAQLAIIGACLDLRLPSKPGEVLLRRIEIKCKKLIRVSEGIDVSLHLHKRLFFVENVYYEGEISVNHDDFAGFGSFIMPLPEKYSPVINS